MFFANNCLQRTRGTIRAASVRAVALALEAERYTVVVVSLISNNSGSYESRTLTTLKLMIKSFLTT